MQKWPFFLGKKRRPILSNFWPIYAKKWPFFLGKKKGGHFEQFWVNFWPIYAKKNGHFWGKKRRGQFGKTLGQFLANSCKKWPFFLGKKRRPILSNFGSIFGQFMQKMAIFSRQKKEANFEQLWVDFLANLCKKWPFFLGKKRGQIWTIFGQFAKEMAIFSRQKKKKANFEPLLGQFLAIF